jgi:type VI secretion system protein ImpI
MFVLRAYRLDNTPVSAEKYRFSNLPIRIGRNPLNDFSPQHSLISAFHARIEDSEGRLCIRDLGSKNGVFVVPSGGGQPIRVDANAAVDLAPGGFRFFLGPHVIVQVEFVQEDAPLRGSQTNGSVLGNVAMIAQPGAVDPRNAGPQGQWAGWAQPGAQQSPVQGAMPAMPIAPVHPASMPPPQHNPSAYPIAPAPLPALGSAPPPGMPQVGGSSGTSQPPGRGEARTQFFNMELESLALQGLRELAGSLTPGRPLETTGDVARLITKLHDTVDVFCRCFIPLRQGYAQFVSSLDLQRAAAQRSMNRSRAALALEGASDAETVAMALLDPRDHTFDAPAAIEGIFADLMLHQVALLDGVMQGVRALLDELSPENIDNALAQRGTGGIFGGKHRARWAEFSERFERLSDERQAFSVIFGQDFAQVYRQYWQRRKEGDEQGLRTDPPRG